MSNKTNNIGHHYSAKVVVVGDVAVGKTSLVRQFTSQYITRDYYMTVGVDYSIKELDIPNCLDINRPWKLKYQIWDTAGQERFRSITTAYYKDATCAILVFALDDPNSFDRIVNVWYPDIVRLCSIHTHIVLVGMKEDCCRSYNRGFLHRVDTWTKEHSIPFFKASVTDPIRIYEIFYETGRELFKLLMNDFDLPGMKCLDTNNNNGIKRISYSGGVNEKKWYDFWSWCF
jgi:small GTP-binding protein